MAASDAELVKAVQKGEQDAYATLVQRYERTVRAVAAGILRDRHATEDVAQEVFVKAYYNLGTLRKNAAFGPWVMQIARREALTLLRRCDRQAASELHSDVAAPSKDGQLDEEAQRLLQAVMKLPEHERFIVMLRHFDGHPVQAIAAATGRSVGTVTKQLTRAHHRLRTWLKELEP
jgi:RNA polymerase sigma-70 factor, ECF subfamily